MFDFESIYGQPVDPNADKTGGVSYPGGNQNFQERVDVDPVTGEVIPPPETPPTEKAPANTSPATTPVTPPPASGGMPPYTGDLAAWVKLILGTQGAYYYGDNPDYWAQRINETGGPTSENLTYWWKRMMTNEGGGHGTPGAGLNPGSIDPSIWTQPFAQTFTPPTYQALPSVPSAPVVDMPPMAPVAPTVDVPPMAPITLPSPPPVPSVSTPSFSIAGLTQPTAPAPTLAQARPIAGDMNYTGGTPGFDEMAGTEQGAAAQAPGLALPPTPPVTKIELPAAPQFVFTAPTAEDAMQEPGAAFRLGEGIRAIERSAAGRGVLNTGGTLKDIINYGQNVGLSEYKNVWDRKFQQAQAEFAPQMTAYTTAANAAAQNAGAANQTNLTAYTTQAEAAVRAALAEYQAKVSSAQQMAEYAQQTGLTQYQTQANLMLQTALEDYRTKAAALQQQAQLQQQATLTGYQTQAQARQQDASMQQQTNLTGYQTQAAAVQHANDMAYQQEWNKYLQAYDAWRNLGNDTWSRVYQAQTA